MRRVEVLVVILYSRSVARRSKAETRAAVFCLRRIIALQSIDFDNKTNNAGEECKVKSSLAKVILGVIQRRHNYRARGSHARQGGGPSCAANLIALDPLLSSAPAVSLALAEAPLGQLEGPSSPPCLT